MQNNQEPKVRIIPAKIRTDKRVAIYCRVSTNKYSQAESLEAQKEGLQQRVKDTLGWTLYKVYEDTASGKNTSRIGFHMMRLDAYDGRFDIVLVKASSRLSRNTEEAIEIVREFKGLGIEVEFETENISTQDPEQGFELSIRMAIAEAEGKSLSEAIKIGNEKRAKSGTSELYRRKCYGYRKDEYGELIINEETAIVKNIYELYLKGYSVDKIMKDLAARHIKSPTGKDRWSKRTIQNMLTNEKYVGNVCLGKTYTGEYPNNKQKINHGEKIQFLAKQAHSPIIANEVYEQVQEEMKRRSNIEIVNGESKRKSTHYSSKGITSADEQLGNSSN